MNAFNFRKFGVIFSLSLCYLICLGRSSGNEDSAVSFLSDEGGLRLWAGSVEIVDPIAISGWSEKRIFVFSEAEVEETAFRIEDEFFLVVSGVVSSDVALDVIAESGFDRDDFRNLTLSEVLSEGENEFTACISGEHQLDNDDYIVGGLSRIEVHTLSGEGAEFGLQNWEGSPMSRVGKSRPFLFQETSTFPMVVH